ncbi:MAG: hypothetical protein JST14_00920 [Bacteroidetes bacterium]|nr:hypothetical protein [Bacteroidota bacterium]
MNAMEDEEIIFKRKLEALRHDWHSLQYKELGKEKLQQFANESPLSRLAKRSMKENLVFGGKVLLTVIVMIVFNIVGSWYTPIPAAWVALLLIDDYIGFRYLYFIPQAESVRMTLQMMLLALRRLRALYALAPLTIWVLFTGLSLWLPLHERATKTAIGLIPVLAFVCYLTWRIWTRRIKEIEERLELYNE